MAAPEFDGKRALVPVGPKGLVKQWRRDCVAVRTAVPWRTRSLTTAGRGAACCSSSLTSFTTWVTRASFNCAAPTEGVTAIRQVKADATAMNLRAVLPNSFFITGMLVIRNGADVGWFIVGLRQLKLECVRLVPDICLCFWARRRCWIIKTDECAAPDDDEVRGDIGAFSYEI